MKNKTMRQVLVCAFLAVGMLFDSMGFFRMTLLCAAVHESAHILVYFLLTRQIPRIEFSIGGIELYGAQRLSRSTELCVLAAGPASNFVFSAALLLRLHDHASYRLYFLAAVSFCTGIYNLIPIGILDGAGILRCLCPAKKLDALQRGQQILLFLLLLGISAAALCSSMPPGARIISLAGPAAAAAREYLKKR